MDDAKSGRGKYIKNHKKEHQGKKENREKKAEKKKKINRKTDFIEKLALGGTTGTWRDTTRRKRVDIKVMEKKKSYGRHEGLLKKGRINKAVKWLGVSTQSTGFWKMLA